MHVITQGYLAPAGITTQGYTPSITAAVAPITYDNINVCYTQFDTADVPYTQAGIIDVPYTQRDSLGVA